MKREPTYSLLEQDVQTVFLALLIIFLDTLLRDAIFVLRL